MTEALEFPLVIPTAFAPRSDVPYVGLKQGDLRNRATVYSIAWWLCQSNFDKIVVVETTGDASLASSLQTLAAACGKTLEFHAIDNDHASVARRGKGFGEGFALDRAWDRSQILQQCSGFFKCTGKIVVENYRECIAFARGKQFYFDAPRTLPNFVDTRFYFATRDFWLRNLRYAYKSVDDPGKFYLEHAYFQAIAQVAPVPFNPIVFRYSGVSGTSGDSYRTGDVVQALWTLRRRLFGFVQRIVK